MGSAEKDLELQNCLETCALENNVSELFQFCTNNEFLMITSEDVRDHLKAAHVDVSMLQVTKVVFGDPNSVIIMNRV